jgi:hypothetical protein
MSSNIANTILLSLDNGLFSAAQYIPKMITGLIVLLIGIILAAIVKRIIVAILKAVRLESYLKRYGIPEAKNEFTWTNILSEIVRWFIIVLFLIPTADIWNLPQITVVLNTILLYLPNVFVASIIGLVGLVFARLASDIIIASTRGLSSQVSQSIATATRVAISIFVLLAVLNQLGVAQDLIKIIFTGFVAMVALAGGISFGLGGKDTAKDILVLLRKKLK